MVEEVGELELGDGLPKGSSRSPTTMESEKNGR
jgi:hypothetical protein